MHLRAYASCMFTQARCGISPMREESTDPVGNQPRMPNRAAVGLGDDRYNGSGGIICGRGPSSQSDTLGRVATPRVETAGSGEPPPVATLAPPLGRPDPLAAPRESTLETPKASCSSTASKPPRSDPHRPDTCCGTWNQPPRDVSPRASRRLSDGRDDLSCANET